MIVGIASADYMRADAPENPMDTEHWGGAGWARLGQYVPYLSDDYQVVVGTLWREGTRGFSIENSDKERYRPDVIIMQRMMHEGIADATRDAQRHGQFIINDLDDWFWGLDTSNAAWLASHEKNGSTEHRGHYKTNIAASDMVTVSTPYLAERMKNSVRCPIRVFPNYVDVGRFRPVRQSPLRIPQFGWAGSTGHRSGDLETVAGVLRPAVNNMQIRLHHSGAGGQSMASVLGIPEQQITTTPLCTAVDYPKLLTFDVGIIPLRDTPFNEAKSYIKGLEYAACGIPFIASASSEYTRLWEMWDGCFHLAKRPKDWISGINRYTDYDNRVKDGQTLLDRVWEHDIQFGVQQWRDLLKEL
jgi:glycosyltransferase involved in cell wall biosynthesis